MRAIVLALVFGVWCVSGAAGQTAAPATRAEALRLQREEKQKRLRPNRVDAVQRALNYIEDPPIFLVARDGFHPKLGTLTTGSGFALGVGYRDRRLLNRYGSVEGWAAGSFKK